MFPVGMQLLKVVLKKVKQKNVAVVGMGISKHGDMNISGITLDSRPALRPGRRLLKPLQACACFYSTGQHIGERP